MACFILVKKIARRTLTCDSTHVLGGTAALRVPYGLGGLQFFARLSPRRRANQDFHPLPDIPPIGIYASVAGTLTKLLVA